MHECVDLPKSRPALLTTDAVVVAVQMSAVARIAAPDRRRARRARGRAIRIGASDTTRGTSTQRLRRSERVAGRRRRAGGRAAMAVVAAILAIVVAALGVEATAVSEGDAGDAVQADEQQGVRSVHGSPRICGRSPRLGPQPQGGHEDLSYTRRMPD